MMTMFNGAAEEKSRRPMWTISSSSADLLFNLSNFLLVVGAAVVLIGTIGSIKMAGIREQFANERISANEAATKRAVADSDMAKAQASDAIARQKEAELQLERLRTQAKPRYLTIDGEGFVSSLADAPKAPVEIMFPKDDGEAFLLSISLRDLLRRADWEVREPVPVPPVDVPRLANQPSIATAGSQFLGVTLVVRTDSQDETRQFGDDMSSISRGQRPVTALAALASAISKALGQFSGYVAGPDIFNAPQAGIIRIVVGPKP